MKTPNHMFHLGTPELVYLDKPAGMVNNDKKVNLLAILKELLGKVSP